LGTLEEVEGKPTNAPVINKVSANPTTVAGSSAQLNTTGLEVVGRNPNIRAGDELHLSFDTWASDEVNLRPDTTSAKVVDLNTTNPGVGDLHTWRKVRYYPTLRAAAGNTEPAAAPEEVLTVELDLPRDPGEAAFAVRAHGTSMDGGKNPIHDGDLVVCMLAAAAPSSPSSTESSSFNAPTPSRATAGISSASSAAASCGLSPIAPLARPGTGGQETSSWGW